MLAKSIPYIILAAVFASPSFAADFESRLSGLEATLTNQQKTIEEQQKLIEKLREELAIVKKQEVASVPGKHAETGKEPKASGISGLFGGSFMTNPYISLTLNSFFYSSNIDERNLRNREYPVIQYWDLSKRRASTSAKGSCFSLHPWILISTFMPIFPLRKKVHHWRKPTSLQQPCRKGSSRRGENSKVT